MKALIDTILISLVSATLQSAVQKESHCLGGSVIPYSPFLTDFT